MIHIARTVPDRKQLIFIDFLTYIKKWVKNTVLQKGRNYLQKVNCTIQFSCYSQPKKYIAAQHSSPPVAPLKHFLCGFLEICSRLHFPMGIFIKHQTS